MGKYFAVLSYPNSNNLGDFIQSIAAKNELNVKEIYELDRDQLHKYNGPKVFLIMNGWFMEKPSNWPPSEKIKPLFLAFHLNPTAKKNMLSAKGINYLKKHQPIGCRDYYTLNLLLGYGIKAHFSGCLTLTLSRKNFNIKSNKRKGIYLISPMERLLPRKEKFTGSFFQKLIQNFKRPLNKIKYLRAIKRLNYFLKDEKEEIHNISQTIDSLIYTKEKKKELAEQHLKYIANAKLVITSRIHSALPAVAFKTPVLFLSDGLKHVNQSSRLDGMENFFQILNSKDLKTFDIKKIKNTKRHIPLVNKMRKEIASFKERNNNLNK